MHEFVAVERLGLLLDSHDVVASLLLAAVLLNALRADLFHFTALRDLGVDLLLSIGNLLQLLLFFLQVFLLS